MDLAERPIGPAGEGVLIAPVRGAAAGVLVLSGSSGRLETDRCRVLARAGLAALSIRWFGGAHQPEGICEIPLETFVGAVDLLRAEGHARIGVLGVSKGAEAALLLAVRDPRVAAVVALSPTSVAWANVGAGADGRTYPYRSSWTWRGEPVPFVGYDETWIAPGPPVAYRPQYERSLLAHPAAARDAAIPVEELAADIVLVAGGDDAMWPSLPFAERLASRRRATLVTSPDAGHRPRLPGEAPAPPSPRFRYGGSPRADAALGERAWPHVLAALRGGT